MSRVVAYYRTWDEERRYRYLLSLLRAGDWGAYFELSVNNL